MRSILLMVAGIAALVAACLGVALDQGEHSAPAPAAPGERAPTAKPVVRPLPETDPVTEADATAAPAPPDAGDRLSGDPIGSFALTYYWIAAEKERAEKTETLYARSCEPIASVSASFARRLAMEGSGRLRDGRLVNAAGACACPRSPCFFVAGKGRQWGVGVKERALAPFRSIAVDPRLVAIGDQVYIPELDGLTMPGRAPWGGFVHDGCLVADDRGGGVKGRKLDLFTGRQGHYRALFRRHRIDRVTVYPGQGRCDEDHPEPVAADNNAS